ncbi:hypothetical protein M0R45_035870 [Rubus argutus]|uniref:ADP-ribosyl cyclase/cyclic ADP-ribose hydrolase n=1 Tax=Rubus argutus TaxID=59490 RepID=A0AAW1VUD0_RUBAR
MAASSSSSNSCKYDVFLSFRGEDTRKNFVCHLYRALEQKLIFTFIDSEDLKKGNKILELLNAIEDSRLSIVVLSENYASSSWCLKELVKILECKATKYQRVVPIYYEVDPSDIRYLKGKFGEAFANKFGGADKQELESWRSALATIADLSGWNSRNYPDDIKLIEKIVEDTLPSRDGKYDVFLSFRGSDTRNNFVSHLYNALERKALSTFTYTEGCLIGDDFGLISKAVDDSKLSVVVFSENYASSRWCLNELVQIMKCMVTKNQIVVPIFYGVVHSDVRHQTGGFGKAFNKHEQNSKSTEEVQSWRSAIIRATNLAGWDSSRSE